MKILEIEIIEIMEYKVKLYVGNKLFTLSAGDKMCLEVNNYSGKFKLDVVEDDDND